MGKRKKKKNKKKKQVEQKPVVEMKETSEVQSLDEAVNQMEETAEQPKEVKEVQAEKPKPKKSPKTARKGLGEELIEVYETSGEQLNSITTFEHKRRSWQRAIVWILVFLVAVFIGVAAVSWYFFGRGPKFSGENVTFEIEAVENINSGEKISYAVRYGNNEDVGFRKAEIELRYPAGFIFEKADPEPTTGDDLFNLSSLPVGEQGVITVEGYLVGKPGNPSTLSGVFRYWPSNFSSEFQEVASIQTEIEQTKLDVRVEGPDQILVGQKTNYSIVFGNEEEEPVKDIAFEMIYPQDFVVENTNPEPTEGQVWRFDEVAPDEELEIQIEGYYAKAPEDAVDFKTLLQHKGAEDYFDQKEFGVPTTVVKGDVTVNTIVNGATSDSTLQWGESVNGSITYQNNSEATLSDITVVAEIESRYRLSNSGSASQGALDWQGLVDSNRGSLKELDATDDKTLRKRSITWTSDEVESLNQLAPESDATINFQIPLRNLSDAKDVIENPEDIEIQVNVKVIIGQTGGVDEELVVSGNPIRLLVDTDLEITGESRYYAESGEELGSGPLPPEVGEKTTYRLFWTLQNSLHEVEDIIVSTDLPSNVNWLADYDVSAGEVDYNSSNNGVTWRLNRLPTDVNSVVLSFSVELNPLASQIDDIANLTKKITMTGTDSSTGGKIIQTILPLTTGVPNDDKASDKGVVIN